MSSEKTGKILVIWTSKDREVALNMAFMYSLNAKLHGWWPEVTLLVWGPSAKLLTEDRELQDYIIRMQEAGVRTVACRKCAENYGIREDLQRLGLEVFYTGQFLTDWLQAGDKVLTV